jgi:rhodanese-related sulfurtransferase
MDAFKDVPVQLLKENERMSPVEVKVKKQELILVDVRSNGEFGMCAIDESINFPIAKFEHKLEELKTQVLCAIKENPTAKGKKK